MRRRTGEECLQAMDSKGVHLLRNAVVGVFATALAVGMFLPVYTDEVGWRFQERAGIDGVDKLYSDICGPNTLAEPPWFMMPVRHFSAFFNTTFPDPFYVRLSGVGYALFWLLLLMLLIRRIVGNRHERAVVATIGTGLVAAGIMPLLLVWSRPEQPMLIAALSALLIAWSDWRDRTVETSAGRAWLRSAGIVAVGVVAISYHLKGVFLTPLFLVCLFLASRGRESIVPRLAAGALLTVLALWAAHYWVTRLECPDDPVLWRLYASHSIGAKLMAMRDWHQLPELFGALIGNMSLVPYVNLAVPINKPMSFWLEYDQVGSGPFFAWVVAIRLTWGLAGVSALASLALSLHASWRKRVLDPRAAVAVVLLGVLLLWAASQLIRNVYEATYVLPLTMLAIVFALAARGGQDRLRAFVDVCAWVIGAAAIVSCAALAFLYTPSIARANGQTGYIAAQPHSQTVFGHSEIRPRILSLARQCGIPEPSKARAVMIDDVSYFPFMQSHLPQHYLGVVANWSGSISDPVAYLKSRDSSGAILACRYLPEDLRRKARRDGALCCLGPVNW